ncbi:MAG TPA: alpha-N-arabinofuranosidase, partial [Chitinophaga sp.]
MKRKYRYIRTGILGMLLSTQALQAQNTVTFRPDAPTQTINRNIYGHFAEHLGNCIYGGFYV